MNIRRIIKEELLKEVGGYDDPNIMAQHAGQVMGGLTSSYNDLSNMLSGLANALVDGTTKVEVREYLSEVFDELFVIIDAIKLGIKDFTEDDLITKSKNIISSLKRFQQKIKILIEMSDAMGSEEEYFERVKKLLMELIPSMKEYGEQLQITNQDFINRISGHNRGAFGSGFAPN